MVGVVLEAYALTSNLGSWLLGVPRTQACSYIPSSRRRIWFSSASPVHLCTPRFRGLAHLFRIQPRLCESLLGKVLTSRSRLASRLCPSTSGVNSQASCASLSPTGIRVPESPVNILQQTLPATAIWGLQKSRVKPTLRVQVPKYKGTRFQRLCLQCCWVHIWVPPGSQNDNYCDRYPGTLNRPK